MAAKLRGLYSPPLMRLAPSVDDERRLGVEPFRALDTVVLPQTGQVLGRLFVFVLLEMLWGQEVGLDLVDVPLMMSAMSLVLKKGEIFKPPVPPCLGQRPLA